KISLATLPRAPQYERIPLCRVRSVMLLPILWPDGPCSRRTFLRQSSLGFGTLAMVYLLHRDGLASAAPGGMDMRPRTGHFPGQAKSVIFLMQSGGPSQIELFDPKPELQRRDGQVHPGPVESFQPGSQGNRLMASAYRYQRHGQCGMDFSELLPCM